MKIPAQSFLLRCGLAVIFLSHSLHGIFTNTDVHDFGNLFLNKTGFSPFGVPLAWAIVISQVITSLLLLAGRFVRISCMINMIILVVGIITVHWKEGWYVVGAGRNGMEFSFILLIILLSLMIHPGSAVKIRA